MDTLTQDPAAREFAFTVAMKTTWIESVFISSDNFRPYPFINIWRRDTTGLALPTTYRQTPNNLRRAILLADALEDKETLPY